jgi:hypothetical protein
MSASAALDAAEFTGRLWAALTDAGTPEPGPATQCLHYPGVYKPAWLAGLPLPLQAPGQPVALASARDFERHHDKHAGGLAPASTRMSAAPTTPPGTGWQPVTWDASPAAGNRSSARCSNPSPAMSTSASTTTPGP